ncbi:MAG: hypothetical protein FD129_3221 [bacterium]|nr:MAG: hypothetical protein FD129_3221 [bacterium]
MTATNQSQFGWWLDDLEVTSTDEPPAISVLADADSATVSWSTPGSSPGNWRAYRRADAFRAARHLVGEATTNGSNDFRASLVDHPPAGRWIYSLRPVTTDGPGLEFDAAAVSTHETTGSAELDLYPNPYRLDGPPLNIEYLLPGTPDDRHAVQIRIFDVAGRLIETVVDGTGTGGLNCRRWPTSSTVPQPATGVYFVKLDVEGQESVHRRLVIRR